MHHIRFRLDLSVASGANQIFPDFLHGLCLLWLTLLLVSLEYIGGKLLTDWKSKVSYCCKSCTAPPITPDDVECSMFLVVVLEKRKGFAYCLAVVSL